MDLAAGKTTLEYQHYYKLWSHYLQYLLPSIQEMYDGQLFLYKENEYYNDGTSEKNGGI